MNETSKTKPGWRIARRLLIALAVMATLIAIFYTEEDWRGKRAWEQCKRRLEAQGVVLDWNKFLPPSLPDDQNFYTASSNILLRFKQIGEEDTNELEAAHKSQWLKLDPFQPNKNAGASDRVPSFPILDTSKTGPIVLAKIIISPKTAVIDSDSNTLVVAFNDSGAAARVRDLIQATMGRTIHGAQGFEFSKFQLTNLQPALIFLQTDARPSEADLTAFIPSETIGEKGRLRLVAMPDRYFFQVQLTRDIRITSAADYLSWSDQFVPAFDDIREALKRPYAILPGDYSIPYRMPIPNFVTMRALAQTLAQRAQCDLLLGKPDQALHELTLVHDVCRILEKPPTGQPETLVEAMINVAITGLYVAIIEDGMKRHEWQEPQLEALQEQLQKINLPPIVFGCLRQDEPAFLAHDAEALPPQHWFSFTLDSANWRDGLLVLMPRGWVYQNMAVAIQLEQLWWSGFDATNQIVFPKKLDASMQKVQRTLGRHRSPYYLLADIGIPNFSKCWQVTAYNQTLVNEAQIACALERCRLVHGEYPDSLDALVPGYMETIPSDIIGGQPLHYRRTDDGKFLLYSVGWNERDDGGQESPHNQYGGITDNTRGDWVWLGGIK